jgi:hypothetical protein
MSIQLREKLYPSSMKHRTSLPHMIGVVIVLATSATPLLAVEWLGVKDADFSARENWKGAPLVANTENRRAENLYLINGTGSALHYTSAQGMTTFGLPDAGQGQLIVGFNDHAGTLVVTGGSLTIYSYWSAIIGQQEANAPGVGTLHVSGGVLRVASTSRSLDRERFFRVGNTNKKKHGAKGTIYISGGLLLIEAEGGPETERAADGFMAGGLNIGRGGGDGAIYINGGVLRVTSPLGTSFVPDDGPATGILTMDLGDGVFEQTASKRLTFGRHPESSGYINFVPGSEAAVSLAGASQLDFDDYIKQGRIRINGEIVEPVRFRFSKEGRQGVLRISKPNTSS